MDLLVNHVAIVVIQNDQLICKYSHTESLKLWWKLICNDWVRNIGKGVPQLLNYFAISNKHQFVNTDIEMSKT